MSCAVFFLTMLLSVSQPAVKASSGQVTAAPAGAAETTAFVTVDNSTMYDVYVVRAEAEAAESVEIVQVTNGQPTSMKEVPVPAYGQLAMAADGVYLRLSGLKQPLAAGQTITITLYTDGGDALKVAAPVR